MADSELVPGEDIAYHQMSTNPISSGEDVAYRLCHLSKDSISSNENQQEITPTPMSKVRKCNQKIFDIKEQPLLEQPLLEQPLLEEQPQEQSPEQPKEQPPVGNGSTEKQNDVQKQKDLLAFLKDYLVKREDPKPCCYCCTCCDCCTHCNCCTCCNCPTCCSCCPRWCPSFKIFPETDTIDQARKAGTAALLKFLFFNLLWPIFREIIVYGGLGVTVVLFCCNIGMLVYNLLRDERQIKITLRYIELGVSAFGLLFTIFDAGLHFRQYGFRLGKRIIAFRTNYKELDLNLNKLKPGEKKFEFFNEKLVCNNIFGKGFAAFMDVARIFVLETILYPKLLLSVFEFIVELVDNDYNPSMILWRTWFTTVLGFLLSLFLVYVLRVFIFARVIYLIGQQIKDSKNSQGISFLVIFVIYMYMMMFLQILMIVIIGSRFHHEYTNYRAIEMSWQLWYMMISACLMPLLGMFTFFLVHHFWTMKLPVDVIYNLLCEFHTKGEKEHKDEDTTLKELKELNEYLGGDKFKEDYNELNEVSFWRKFIYPYISPFHVIAILIYGLIFSGFFVCCTLEGPYGNWLWFYVATGILAILINIYSASVACVWLLIFIITISIVAVAIAIIVAILAVVVGIIAIILGIIAAFLFTIAIIIIVIVGSGGAALLPLVPILVPILCIVGFCYCYWKNDECCH